MHETEAERRLRQLGGGEFYWYDADRIMAVYGPNPCEEIVLSPSSRCALGIKPLVKFTKFKFNFGNV